MAMRERHGVRKERSAAIRVGSLHCEFSVESVRPSAMFTIRLESGQVWLHSKSHEIPPLMGMEAVSRVVVATHGHLSAFREEVVSMTKSDRGVFAFQRKDINQRIAERIASDVREAQDFFTPIAITALYFGWGAAKEEEE